jgi:hypothetical protein
MKIIAYYLPQFHQIKENDEWWGEGFTEWTSVRKARPLFKGHEQPKVPGILGYYNLLDSSTRDAQAALAEKGGIDAFCYWHYWFGGGKVLLETPFREVLRNKKPELAFCLGWANESWKAKTWNSRLAKQERILIEQHYLGEDDNARHFFQLLDAFKDPRYLKIEDKPVFVIYRPLEIPNPSTFLLQWQELARKNGLKGIFFIAHTMNTKDVKRMLALGYDAVNMVRLGEHKFNRILQIRNAMKLLRYKYLNFPLVFDYRYMLKYFTQKEELHTQVFPSIIPNWDHTPRSGRRGMVLINSNPVAFRQHVRNVMATLSAKPEAFKVVFVKSWNEWGEGNYMEPDSVHGEDYLEVLRQERLY